MSGFYESDDGLAQYLLFHYGTAEQICPVLPEARGACGFPSRCVSGIVPQLAPGNRRRALDLGCAVGRSSFELRKYFGEVVGIDFSHRFVEAAQRMARERVATVRVPREGQHVDEIRLELPVEVPTESVKFEQGDAGNLRADIGKFDLILMANLIDRLPEPGVTLMKMAELVEPSGWLVITSPYTWLEEYTDRSEWLADGANTSLSAMKKLLQGFELKETRDMPFLIREHRRKYQWSVAEVSVWRRV